MYGVHLKTCFKFDQLTTRELFLRRVSVAFREIQGWDSKLDDPVFIADWLKKFLDEVKTGDGGGEKYGVKVPVWVCEDFRFWKGEVEEFRRFKEGGGGVEGGDYGVWKMEGVLSEEERKRVIDATATLEPSPDTIIPTESYLYDGWPSSPHSILDPSLNPAIYGKTLIYSSESNSYTPFLLRRHTKPYNQETYHIPTDFQISSSGKTKILGYINNLVDVGHAEVFHPVFEGLFEKFVGLFGYSLAESAEGSWWRSKCRKRELERGYDGYPNASVRSSPEDGWHRPDMRILKHVYERKLEEMLGQIKSGEEDVKVGFFGEGAVYDYDCAIGKEENVLVGDKWEFVKRGWWRPPEEVGEGIKGRTVKVFVRVFSMVVPPGEEGVEGGDWTLTGTLNERVVATGVYCYSRENVTDPRLRLRRNNFSTLHWKPQPQEVEGVPILENRAFVFSGNYEYKMPHLKLVDDKKPGHLKMVMFHLCDPDFGELLSTQDIIPQQPGLYEKILRSSSLGTLPEDIFSLILEYLPLPTKEPPNIDVSKISRIPKKPTDTTISSRRHRPQVVGQHIGYPPENYIPELGIGQPFTGLDADPRDLELYATIMPGSSYNVFDSPGMGNSYLDRHFQAHAAPLSRPEVVVKDEEIAKIKKCFTGPPAPVPPPVPVGRLGFLKKGEVVGLRRVKREEKFPPPPPPPPPGWRP
ncbi:hypothetical protein TWF730_001908 [Orbilia blumenaviensis]|uniref:DUF4246 domain-containing protein n=1 Tax=Orbilia blumenaviensis TaxID=1796055 RepID=A0AAV9UEQ0_9PEZI